MIERDATHVARSPLGERRADPATASLMGQVVMPELKSNHTSLGGDKWCKRGSCILTSYPRNDLI